MTAYHTRWVRLTKPVRADVQASSELSLHTVTRNLAEEPDISRTTEGHPATRTSSGTPERVIYTTRPGQDSCQTHYSAE
jgi:hypothetical protein